MGLLTVDESKCKKDGLCAAECPTVIINIKKKKSFPFMVDGGEEICLRCGHCVAVCPHGALTHVQVPIEKSPSIKKELHIDKGQAVQFLRSRRSIRFFQEKPVEKEILQELIEIARYAPSASNAQPVEWIVYTNKEKIRHLAQLTIDWMRDTLEKEPAGETASYLPLIVAGWDMGYDAVLRNAPALIVASAHKTAGSGMVDVSLAMSYLDLMAPMMGLGTCWAGLLQNAIKAWKPITAALAIPEEYVHHYPMILGYAKTKYHRLPERQQPKITWK